ncbi:MAG: hypothetical protein NE334_17235 [Lentisphaeraceae bacterium]|nr:hypothetical protein [Lentisphaeraceae bacterium]
MKLFSLLILTLCFVGCQSLPTPAKVPEKQEVAQEKVPDLKQKVIQEKVPDLKQEVTLKKTLEPKREVRRTFVKSHQQVVNEQKELSRKIAQTVQNKLDAKHTSVKIRNIEEPLKSTFISGKNSYIHASKIVSVEIDGKRFLKLTLENSKQVITLPIYKSYKSGKKIVSAILSIDDRTTRNEFIVSQKTAESDLMLGEEFIIKNYIK